MMWFNRNVTTLNSTLQLLNMLVANSCDVQKQPLNEFQEQKKKKKNDIERNSKNSYQLGRRK